VTTCTRPERQIYAVLSRLRAKW